VRPADRWRCCFRKAEVPDLALLNQVLHRSRHIFDRYVRVAAVLIEKIDHAGLEALERRLGNLLDVLWTAVAAPSLSRLRIEIMTKLGCDHYLIADRRMGFADELFVGEWAI